MAVNKKTESIGLDTAISLDDFYGLSIAHSEKFGHSLFDPFSSISPTWFFDQQFKGAAGSGTVLTAPALIGPPLISVGPNVIELTAKDASATTATAYTLDIGQTARGVITTKGDHDFYKVPLLAGQAYTFAEIGTGINSLKDPYLAIMNSTGKTVAVNDDGGPAASALLTYTPTASGNYYINAGAFNNASTGQYGISVTSGSKASFDIEMGGGALDSFLSWSPTTTATAATVSYGFRSALPTGYTAPANFSALSSNEITAVKLILSLWSDVAQVKFTEVIDPTITIGGVSEYSNNATIEIANYSANDGAGAFAYYPGSTLAASSAGDLWLNLSGGVTTSGVTPGTYPFFAIMHELGHALGLSHPGDYNAGLGVAITYANSAQFIQDSEMYSVMSYFAGSYTGENPGAFATAYTPLLLDIYEIQNLYGANTATRTGNTTYGFNASSTAGSLYEFSGKVNPQFCVWDGGGVDTLDCSGYAGSQSISLVAGTFSSVDGATNNVSIALGCTVENAIGGSGNDVIVANSSANSLAGGDGADTFKYFLATDSTSSARDTIVDFVHNLDILDLSAIDANSTVLADQAFNFIGNANFTGAGQLHFSYDANLNQTIVEANTDSNVATVEFTIALVGNVALAAADMIL